MSRMGDSVQLETHVIVDFIVCHHAGRICNYLSVTKAASRIQDAAFSISSSVCSTVTTTLMLKRGQKIHAEDIHVRHKEANKIKENKEKKK